MKKIQYHSGQKMGNCVFIKEVAPKINPGRSIRIGRFRCGCGNEFESYIQSVKQGRTTSCGCVRKRINSQLLKTHGLSKTPTHRMWLRMKSRCCSKINPGYNYYGGRGITVCREWLDDFMVFHNYVISLPNAMESGYSIDRIDNDGNYKPGNIRWADKHTQTANKRSPGGEGGYVGVFRNYKKFSSKITIRGKVIFIGSFDTPKKAGIARNNYIIKNQLWEYPIQEIKIP